MAIPLSIVTFREYLIKSKRHHGECPFPFRKCPRAMNLTYRTGSWGDSVGRASARHACLQTSVPRPGASRDESRPTKARHSAGSASDVMPLGSKSLDRLATLTNQKLVARVHGEARRAVALRRHGCRSEHSRSEWPGGKAAGGSLQSRHSEPKRWIASLRSSQ